jgi:SAM-dependent methyltransferase
MRGGTDPTGGAGGGEPAHAGGVALAARPSAAPHPPPLPPEFDPALYAARHASDLAGLNVAALAHHYTAHGAAEGRACSAVASRGEFLALLPPSGPVLEVGPFCTPWAAPPGCVVRYLDVMPTEALRAAAAALTWGDASSVPEIDYVWRGEPYRQLIRERFAAILSSHCIEHQPCLVTHLADLAAVLAPGGRVFLVVPDHRFAFDHFVPSSSLVDVLDAYAARRTTHAPRSLIAQHLLHTHNDATEHWRGEHGPDPWARPAGPELAAQVAEALRGLRGPDVIYDVHAWQFTPESFRRLFESMAAAGLSPFRIERLYPTLRDRGEFYAVLRIAA